MATEEEGSQPWSQLFLADGNILVHVGAQSLNAVDLPTGEALWTAGIPTDSVIHLYDDMFFWLSFRDDGIPFAPGPDIKIPADCNSSDMSTISAFDPRTGLKTWQYSYRAVFPNDIRFKGNSAYIHGINSRILGGKYISLFEIDVRSGRIMAFSCHPFNSYSSPSEDEGSRSSGFYPIQRERDWERKGVLPFFTAERNNLIMFDRESKQPVGEIVFSGADLNPYETQLIIQDDFLVVYLSDSNQIFTFRMKQIAILTTTKRPGEMQAMAQV